MDASKSGMSIHLYTSVILTVYYVKSNHNTDVDLLTLLNVNIIFFKAFDQYISFVILGVEAGQCSYVALNFEPNLSLNVLINKVLINKVLINKVLINKVLKQGSYKQGSYKQGSYKQGSYKQGSYKKKRVYREFGNVARQ